MFVITKIILVDSFFVYIQKLFCRYSAVTQRGDSDNQNNRINNNTTAVAQRCSVKKVFLETLQNSQENTCARVSILIKLQA